MNQAKLASPAQAKPAFLPARKNPLSMEHVTRIKFRFANRDWPSHLERLKGFRYRASIVGPQGSGKTTLLFELAEQFQQSRIRAHHLFLPQARETHAYLINQAIGQSSEGAILLVDGIERLTLTLRWSLLKNTKSAPGLVVNLHRPCRFPERLPIWIATSTSLDLISEILIELDLDFPEIQSAAVHAFKARKGNIREALRDLYDQFATGRFNRILSG